MKSKYLKRIFVALTVMSICLACLVAPASAASVDIVFPFAEPDIWIAFTNISTGASIVIVDISTTGSYRVVVNSGGITVASDSVMHETTVDVYLGTFNSAYPPILRQLETYAESDYSCSYAIPGLSSHTETSYYGFACHNDFATLDFQKIPVGVPFNVITPIFGNVNYKTYLESIDQGIATSNSWLSKIWTSITDGFDSVGNWISTQTNAITATIASAINSVGTWISDQTGAITSKLQEVIDAIVKGTPGMQDAADNAQNVAGNASDSLGSASDSLGAVGQPDVDVNGIVPGELLGTDFVNYTNVLTVVWNNSTLTSMVTILAGFLLMSLLLNGTRE